MGDQILVKVINIDPQGKVKLSRKAVLKEQRGEVYEPPPPRPDRGSSGGPHGRHGDRGPRPGSDGHGKGGDRPQRRR
jgi:polyribonucleotide nucleotidyltransferase